MHKTTREKAKAAAIPFLIGAVIFVVQMIYLRYPNSFPVINQQIFEQLIQINITIFGFTLVGMLYITLESLMTRRRSMPETGLD